MTKKIVLTVMIIVALLIAIYKWIMSDDVEIEEQQKVEETETETSETENVKPETNAEEVKENGNDTVENHNK